MLFVIQTVAFVGILLLFSLALWSGYKTGHPARHAMGVTLSAVAPAILLIGAARTQAEKVGPVVMQEALLLSCLLITLLVGGFFVGLALQRQQRAAANIGTAVVVVLTTLLVTNAMGRLNAILSAAHELGLDKSIKYEPEKNKACPENLKSLYIAFQLYAQDWDALPPAPNWLDNDDLTSKVRQNEWLHCPAVSNRTDEKYGYAYNDSVATKPLNHKELKAQPNAATTPLVYDSMNLAKNAHDAFASLPKPGRHSGRNNVLYLDGHVEAAAPK